MDELAPQTLAYVRAAIGLPTAQNDVLENEPVHDKWFVSGQRVEQEDRLRIQRKWLRGKQTGRPAMILELAVGTSGFKSSFLSGSVVEADVCFFPYASPLRALAKQIVGNPEPATQIYDTLC